LNKAKSTSWTPQYQELSHIEDETRDMKLRARNAHNGYQTSTAHRNKPIGVGASQKQYLYNSRTEQVNKVEAIVIALKQLKYCVKSSRLEAKTRKSFIQNYSYAVT